MDKEVNGIKIINEFFKSDLDEAEFFGLPKDNTITLGEYQEMMHDVDFRFQQMAQFEIYSAKEKCPWIEEIWFQGLQNIKSDNFSLSSIHIFSKDKRELFTNLDKESKTYDAIIKIPFIYLLNKEIRLDIERAQQLYMIQEELKEIEAIGKDIYNHKLHHKESISDRFYATYRPDAGLYLFDSNSDNVTAYLKEGRKDYDKPLVKEKNKAQLLRKILIKK